MQKRTENAAYLLRQLADLTDVLILPQADSRVKPSWFGFLISVKPEAKFTKQQLVEYLEKNGVGTRQLFAGNLLRQPLMVENDVPLRIGAGPLQNSRDLTEADYQKLPNTDFIMNNTFWVGVFPRLGKPELDKTARLIREFAARHK